MQSRCIFCRQVAACETIIEKLRNDVAERNMALVNLDENEEEAFRQRKRVQPQTPTASQNQLPATTQQMSTAGGLYSTYTKLSISGRHLGVHHDIETLRTSKQRTGIEYIYIYIYIYDVHF